MSSTTERLTRTSNDQKAPATYRHVTITKQSSSPGALYGLGFIGAAVYYVQHARTFRAGVIGLFKALVWPALLIFRVLKLLEM